MVRVSLESVLKRPTDSPSVSLGRYLEKNRLTS